MSQVFRNQRLFCGLAFLLIFYVADTPITIALSATPSASHSAFSLSPISSGDLTKPLFLTHAGDGSGRLFVVEKFGKIFIIDKGQLLPKPFLDISTLLATRGERGLLGLAFHQDYSKNGRYFINYTRKQDGATVIAELHRSPNPQRSETNQKILLVMPQPYGNHNGGMVAFGPDGFLYIGMGDGGAGGDPEDRGQNSQELLGKILRIDIDQGDPYGIPPDNPFAKSGGRPEIYATGFRNPWRFSFDRQTHTLWVGDVGQNSWEEVSIVKNGENHGWRFMEGKHCFHPKQDCQGSKPLTLPVIEYQNGKGRCSVTGGYVYRGNKIPDLQGTYVFADFCSGEIFGYVNGSYQVLLDTDLQIPSFGEDEDGELYVLGFGGTVYRVTPSSESSGFKK